MLDTSRNYFSVETIERILIGMSHAKMNRFHWHISDSQSFPYVSKAYPQLAKYGAYSEQEVYTPNDIRGLTEFARVRGIQILPEIDAPAHIGSGRLFAHSLIHVLTVTMHSIRELRLLCRQHGALDPTISWASLACASISNRGASIVVIPLLARTPHWPALRQRLMCLFMFIASKQVSRHAAN